MFRRLFQQDQEDTERFEGVFGIVVQDRNGEKRTIDININYDKPIKIDVITQSDVGAAEILATRKVDKIFFTNPITITTMEDGQFILWKENMRAVFSNANNKTILEIV